MTDNIIPPHIDAIWVKDLMNADEDKVGQISSMIGPERQEFVLDQMTKIAETTEHFRNLRMMAGECRNSIRKSVFFAACQDRSEEVVRALWSGMTGEKKKEKLNELFGIACASGRIELAQDMLKSHPTLDLEQSMIETCWAEIKVQQTQDMLKFLIEQSKSPKAKGVFWRRVVGEAMGKKLVALQTVDVLLPYIKLDDDDDAPYRINLLLIAVNSKRDDLVQRMIPLSRASEFRLAIKQAVSNRQDDLARLLIDKAPALTDLDYTVFLHAAASKNAGLLGELIAYDDSEKTRKALLVMCFDRPDTVSFLLKHHAGLGETTEEEHQATNLEGLDNAWQGLLMQPNDSNLNGIVRTFLDSLSRESLEKWLKNNDTDTIEWVSEMKKSVLDREDMAQQLGSHMTNKQQSMRKI